MFWGYIVYVKKGSSLFWEKEWGSINSTRYDERILSLMEQFFRDHPLASTASGKTMPPLTARTRQD
jgi:hypothetical protein